MGLNLPHLLIVCSNILYVLLNLFRHSAPPACWPFFSRLSSCASQNSSKADWISLACVFNTARPCCPSASRSFTSALFRKRSKRAACIQQLKAAGVPPVSPLHGAAPLDPGQVLVCSWGKVLARLGETGQKSQILTRPFLSGRIHPPYILKRSELFESGTLIYSFLSQDFSSRSAAFDWKMLFLQMLNVYVNAKREILSQTAVCWCVCACVWERGSLAGFVSRISMTDYHTDCRHEAAKWRHDWQQREEDERKCLHVCLLHTHLLRTDVQTCSRFKVYIKPAKTRSAAA